MEVLHGSRTKSAISCNIRATSRTGSLSSVSRSSIMALPTMRAAEVHIARFQSTTKLPFDTLLTSQSAWMRKRASFTPGAKSLMNGGWSLACGFVV
jgi:hypothetical protein